MAKKDEFTREQKFELIKGLGRGLVETLKQPIPAYTVTSLAILALGKAKVLSCGVVGTLQGVNTYLAISQQVEEAGDAGFFGIGGMGETLAKGGASITIGSLWGMECALGRQHYDPSSSETKAQIAAKKAHTESISPERATQALWEKYFSGD